MTNPRRPYRLYPPQMIVAILLALALGVSLRGMAHAASSQRAAPATSAENCDPGACSGTYYGANISAMTQATSRWPQINSNWCGISNIQAIEEYAWWKYNGQWNQGTYTQTAIYNDLNLSRAVSPWGAGTGYVKADISGDFGTDPRSIEWGAYDVTPSGYYFHNYIYQTDAGTATVDFALDFGPYHGVNNPISITVLHGQHSVVVGGVYASSDPSRGDEALYGIDTWDPGVGSRWGGVNGTREEVWSYSEWTTNSHLWGLPYSANWNGSSYEDPDPDTPTNYYVPPFPSYGNQATHWINYYVTIEQDGGSTPCGSTPNYALDQYGNLSPHNGTC